MSENFTLSLPPVAIRAELDKLVLADLLGPTGGPTEIVDNRLSACYIVGVLAPARGANNQEESGTGLLDDDKNIGADQGDLATGAGDDGDEESAPTAPHPKQ